MYVFADKDVLTIGSGTRMALTISLDIECVCLLAPPLDPLVFLVALVVDFWCGVEGAIKWKPHTRGLGPTAPARILKMRSEITQRVGHSRLGVFICW